MTIQKQIIRPTIDALGVVLEDIGGLSRGERDYIDGPRAVVVPPLEAIARLTACVSLLPSVLLDPGELTEWELDFAAHELRDAALVFARPSRYVAQAQQLEALAHTVAATRLAEIVRTFGELPARNKWRDTDHHNSFTKSDFQTETQHA